MAVRKTESRLPKNLGYKPEDLGQVGVLDYSDPSLQEPDCFLISYLSTPVCVGYKNTYVVFVTDASLANRIDKFTFTIEQRNTDGWYEEIDGYRNIESPNGIYTFPRLEPGFYKIKAKLIDNADAELRVLSIKQQVMEIDRKIKDQIDQHCTQIAIAGNPEITADLYHNYVPYVNDVKWNGSKLEENRNEIIEKISGPGNSGDNLVLLIQGDLLKRYPNTVIYAVKTINVEDGQNVIKLPALDEFIKNYFSSGIPQDIQNQLQLPEVACPC